jgi:hypothetical protein
MKQNAKIAGLDISNFFKGPPKNNYLKVNYATMEAAKSIQQIKSPFDDL